MEINPFTQLTKPPPKINKIHIIKKCPHYHLVESSCKNSTCLIRPPLPKKVVVFLPLSSKKICTAPGQIKVVWLLIFKGGGEREILPRPAAGTINLTLSRSPFVEITALTL